MTRSLRILAAAVVVSVVALPWSPRRAGAIAHGTDAREGDYRFSVLLTMTGLPADDGGTRDSSCSGALIAPRWVLTAGHCFRDAAGRRVNHTVAERTVAVVGRTDLRTGQGREVEVVGAYQADGADVALAKLSEPVTDVTPARVATEPPVRGEVLRLTGYGLIGDGGRAATRLQTGQFTVEAIGADVIQTAGRAPHPDTSPCLHDSGGPYFQDGTFVVAAVVSSGPSCPHTGPDLSARVDNLRGWIADTTASSHGPEFALAGAAFLVVVVAVLWCRRWFRNEGRRLPNVR